MPDTLILLLIAGLLAAATGLFWIHRTAQRRAELQRTHGYSLIHSLMSYSAWVEGQRDVEVTAPGLDKLDLPEPLTRAGDIARLHFPLLSEPMAELVQSHFRLTEYLWDHQLIRLSKGFGGPPAYQDPEYQQLRGAQEDLIDDLIRSCRELIGDADVPWHATGSEDVERNRFSSSSTPAGRA